MSAITTSLRRSARVAALNPRRSERIVAQNKPSVPKPAAPKYTVSRPTASRLTASRLTASRPTASRPATPRPATPRPAMPRPTAPCPTKPQTAAPQTAAPRPAVRHATTQTVTPRPAVRHAAPQTAAPQTAAGPDPLPNIEWGRLVPTSRSVPHEPYVFMRQSIRIGRSDICEIRETDQRISRYHLGIQLLPPGQTDPEDDWSPNENMIAYYHIYENGFYINNESQIRGSWGRLYHNDVLTLYRNEHEILELQVKLTVGQHTRPN
ncbi:Protein kinase protein rad53 [Rhizina undulata]